MLCRTLKRQSADTINQALKKDDPSCKQTAEIILFNAL